ncbi:MAG: 1-acyl-sn-glycerol-3-phosphate acyltransferase [Bacteroidales bacterium]|nr:1-acyl-sn-glycerol-3-phosphate acyltransferase [Bacteroidales bacterium]MBN2699226.1 1-acyl-sn-glycerol-3-phosphate acyltransferase [Bacteroidales bacterium]
MKRRVKRIAYNRRRDNQTVFDRFRERYLDRYYPDCRQAELSFRHDLKKLSANFSKLFFFQYSLFSEYRFHKSIYRSIRILTEKAGVEDRIRQASLNGTLFYLPNHQAHIDSLVVSWLASNLGVPQPLFCAWSTLAKRRSAYLMPMVNACLLNREIMDHRFRSADPFRNTRKYRVGYKILLNEYLNHMLAGGVDTLVYPEATRSYSGAVGEARIKGIFKGARMVQQELGAGKSITVVPVSISYSLVPEAEQLIHSHYTGSVMPPSSLFHDFTFAEQVYRTFRPDYQTKTCFPFIKAFSEYHVPIFCVAGDPISLKDHPETTLEACFEAVKRNLKILPHYFMARLLLSDPPGHARQWTQSGIEGLMKPAQQLRDTLKSANLDEAFSDDAGLADIISIGMEFLKNGGYISADAQIVNKPVIEYYSNKLLL